MLKIIGLGLLAAVILAGCGCGDELSCARQSVRRAEAELRANGIEPQDIYDEAEARRMKADALDAELDRTEGPDFFEIPALRESYRAADVVRTGSLVTIVTRQDSPLGVLYTERHVDCRRRKFKQGREAETLSALRKKPPEDSEFVDLVAGSSADASVTYACAHKPA